MALDFSKIELCVSSPLMIRIWPDGTNVILEDVREGEGDHMSDDYVDINLYDWEACKAFPDQKLLRSIAEDIMGTEPFGPEGDL